MSISAKAYRKAAVTEHSMQVALVQYLRLSGRRDIQVFAIPNAGKRSLYTAAGMKAEGMLPGVADLCIMLPGGKVVWIELKTAKGRQSLAQKNFQLTCKVLEHPYLMPRSFSEAVTMLRNLGLLR